MKNIITKKHFDKAIFTCLPWERKKDILLRRILYNKLSLIPFK